MRAAAAAGAAARGGGAGAGQAAAAVAGVPGQEVSSAAQMGGVCALGGRACVRALLYVPLWLKQSADTPWHCLSANYNLKYWECYQAHRLGRTRSQL